jgi:hypothetical protein
MGMCGVHSTADVFGAWVASFPDSHSGDGSFTTITRTKSHAALDASDLLLRTFPTRARPLIPSPPPPALTRTMSTLFSRNQVWLAEATVSGFCNDRAWTALLNDYFTTHPKLQLRIPPVPSTVGGPISAYCDSVRREADGDGAGAAVLSHDANDNDNAYRNEGDDDSADVGARSRPPVHAAFRGGSNMSDSTARAALSIDGPHFEFLTRKSHHLLAIGWIISVRQRPPGPMWLKARVLAIYPAHIAVEVLGHEGPHGPLVDVAGDSPAKGQ